eukprot:jgi/Chlat1/4624/Chrsp3S05582
MMSHSEVQRLADKLRDDRARTRKEGLRQLNNVLESDSFLLQLDRETEQLDPGAQVPAWTWPGLCHSLCKTITLEMEAYTPSHKKPPDPMMSRTLKKLVMQAERRRKAGKSSLHLLLSARKLFRHAQVMLDKVPLFKTDYTSVLREFLLPVPEYCKAMTISCYSDLVRHFAQHMQDALQTNADTPTASAETFRDADALVSLFEHAPFDLPLQDREELFLQFCEIAKLLRDNVRGASTVLTSINAFLLRYGLDIGTDAKKLYQDSQPFVEMAWRGARMPKLKESLVLYVSLQMQLRGIMEVPGALEQLRGMVDMDLHSKAEGLTLSRQQSASLQLAVLVYVERLKVLDNKVSTEDMGLRSSDQSPLEGNVHKKQRTMTLQEQLTEQLTGWRGQWPQFFCMLVCEHAKSIPLHVLLDWLQKLPSIAERIVGDARAGQNPEPAIWLMRFLVGICKDAPSMVSRSRRGQLSTNQGKLGVWQDLWNKVVQWLPFLQNSTKLVEEMLHFLSTVLSQDLVPSAKLLVDFWQLGTFRSIPSWQALEFVTQILVTSAAQDSAAWDTTAFREQLLEWSISHLHTVEGSRNRLQLAATGSAGVVLQQVVMALAFGSSARQALNNDALPRQHWREEEDSLEPDLNQLNKDNSALAASVVVSNQSAAQQVVNNQTLHKQRLDLTASAIRLLSRARTLLCDSLAKVASAAENELQNATTPVSGDDTHGEELLFSSLAATIVADGVVAAASDSIESLQCWGFGGAVESAVARTLNSYITAVTTHQAGTTLIKPLPLHVQAAFRTFVDLRIVQRGAGKSGQACCEGKPWWGSPEGLHAVLARWLNLLQQSVVVLSQGHPSLSQAALAEPSTDFDEELDALPAASDQTTPKVADTDSSSRQFGYINLIRSLGPVMPSASVTTMKQLLHSVSRSTLQHARQQLFYLCCCVHHEVLAEALELLAQPLVHASDDEDAFAGVLKAIQSCAQSLLSSKTPQSLVSEKLSKIVTGALDLDKPHVQQFRTRENRIQFIQTADALLRLNAEHYAAALCDMLLPLIRDTDFVVRQHMARILPIMFDCFSDHVQVFTTLKQVLEDDLGTGWYRLQRGDVSNIVPEHAETAILALGQVAVASAAVEKQAVFMLCAHAALYQQQEGLVAAVLDSVAAQLTYTSRLQFMKYHQSAIAEQWVTDLLPLEDLQYVQHLLVGEGDLQTYYTSLAGFLLPSLMVHKRRGDLEQLITFCGASESTLQQFLKNHFAAVFARLLLAQARDILQGPLLKDMQLLVSERAQLLKKRFTSVVMELLDCVSADDDPAASLYPAAAVTRAILDTALLCYPSANSGPAILSTLPESAFPRDHVMRVLLRLDDKLKGEGHYRHHRHTIAAVQVLVDVLGQPSHQQPSIARYVLHMTVQMLGIRQLQLQCCSFLLQFIKGLFNEANTAFDASIIGEQLQSMVPRLLACAFEHHSGPLNSEAPDEVAEVQKVAVALLHLVTISVPTALHIYIRSLEPFPDLPELAAMASLHQQLRASVTAQEDVREFAAYYDTLSAGQRARRCDALLRTLDKQCINNDDPDALRWKDSETLLAVWKLVVASGKVQGDVSLHHLAAQLLPLVNMEAVDAALQSTQCMTAKQCSKGTGTLQRVLEETASYLIDGTAAIISIAMDTAKGMLATEQGRRAYLELGSKYQNYLQAFDNGPTAKRFEDARMALEAHKPKKISALDDPTLWDADMRSYEAWICNLVFTLTLHVDDDVLQLCHALALRKAKFAEVLLPHVLANLAQQDDPQVRNALSRCISENVFAPDHANINAFNAILASLNVLRVSFPHLANSSQPTANGSNEAGCNGSSARNTRKTLTGKGRNSGGQVARPVGSDSAWSHVYWLSIDYLQTAEAAYRCSAYYTALMYVEYWCEAHFGGLRLGEPDLSDETTTAKHERMLLEIYTQIDEPDSIYGVARTHKLVTQLRVHAHERNWSKALQGHDLALRTRSLAATGSEATMHHGLLSALQHMGCTQAVDAYWRGLCSMQQPSGQDAHLAELQFEAAWRSGNWSSVPVRAQPPHVSESGHFAGFNAAICSILRALDIGDHSTFDTSLQHARQGIIRSVVLTSAESVQSQQPSILQLDMLEDLACVWPLRWPTDHTVTVDATESGAHPSDLQIDTLQQRWLQSSTRKLSRFDLVEPRLALGKTLLQALKREDRLPSHLLNMARSARKAGYFGHSEAAMYELKLLSSVRPELSQQLPNAWRIEEAKLLWGQQQHRLAINLGKFLLQAPPQSQSSAAVVRSSLQSLVGQWLSQTHAESSRVILNTYLEGAVQGLQSEQPLLPANRQAFSKAQYRLAQFADSLFRSLDSQIQSIEWQRADTVRKHKQEEFTELERRIAKTRDKYVAANLGRQLTTLKKELAYDEEHENRLTEDRSSYLHMAVQSFYGCLSTGNKFDMQSVFRLVSLWFAFSTLPTMNDEIVTAVRQVPSYKFLPLVYQIASRLSSSRSGPLAESGFLNALSELLFKLASDHPYHALYQLFALHNGDRVKDDAACKAQLFEFDRDKKAAATELLGRIRKHSQSLNGIISQVDKLIDLYIVLAELPNIKTASGHTVPGQMPRDMRNLHGLDLVPVITAKLPVDPSGKYPTDSFPHIVRFAEEIQLVGGINAPKLIQCIGSDGQHYRQLVKSGNDDLRQDAVMEQLFGLVDTLLQHNPETLRRNLRMRTYKVIPFTPTAGVVEWVENTMPVAEYLLGTGSRKAGAHAKYRPNDYTYQDCRDTMASVAKAKPGKQRSVFDNICKSFHPVFHHFFLETFPHPATWFQRRLAYTRSVAVSSMVGYIIGLGDRHSSNILIDKFTAEVIHIDLGIAFEQGKLLNTPEVVPFRLTRDYVDGMGVCGVEGVFRRCCELVLEVMRNNKDALVTIIEVFLHDPLYKWALSPFKALQRQRDAAESVQALTASAETTEGNKGAERALLRIKQKLDGYEDGEMRGVQGQVQQLIHDAQDPDKLCTMFAGWGAWM